MSSSQPLAILYEDAHCLAVVKPASLLSAASSIANESLETAVRHYLKPDAPAEVYLGIVHRLDRPVSGVVLWAKTPKAARRLAEQFARRETHKQYWAIVEGVPAAERGRWEDWLYEDRSTGLGRVQVCSRQTPRARQAVTRFEVGRAERLPEGCSWLTLLPETGRTHQLRVQAAARGLPIVGDRQYGASREFPLGIALHARSLTVQHPVLHQPMTLVAPLPEEWKACGIELDRAV